ncbi:MAG: ferritin family protein [Syntrophales bacterium]|jgi:rubrerythrin|nr:ferritin family protein [Syntrophales bacterium]MCK9527359.1 ferritin family protein [Syntrophales bacterium]MDX9921171.1 ferritin family protein [Syntrophales bacterium]
MDQKNRLNALDTALKNEMAEREFYLANAERTGNPLGKAMFKEIADDELDHYERLLKLQETWENERKWPETIPLTVKKTNVGNILAGMMEKVKTMPPGNDDDRAALRKAIDFEAKGVEFYRGLRDMVQDPRERAFFDLLASIEEEHYVSLKETEEYLIDPAAWYRSKERGGGLDGA